MPSPQGRGDRGGGKESERPSAEQTAAARINALGRIWADVLGVEAVRPADDFFALGGHSLLALRMVSAVREAFGLDADLAMLFRRPTLGAFARALFGLPETDIAAAPTPAPPVWEASVYRRGHGPLTVYTLNHPFLYYRLAAALPEHVSVVNLHMFNAEIDGVLRALSIEEIVAEAIRIMDADGKDGPVAVLGLCVNGILAIEMARQLRQRGADVRFVAAIDSWAPGFARTLPPYRRFYLNKAKRLKRALYFAGKLLRGDIGPIGFLKEFNLSRSLLRRFGVIGPPSREDLMNGAVTQLLTDAAQRYAPRPVTREQVMLFRSRAHPREASELLFGWKPFVGVETRVLDLEGWHEDSLTEAGIDTLAAAIRARIAADIAA